MRWFARPETDAIRRLVFSPDGYYLALAVDGKIRVWDVRARKDTIALSIDGELPMSLEFSFDHKVLMAGFDSGLVKFWQLRA